MNIIMVIFTLTAGSAVLMWIGERITEKGVGNGISIVLTINIISRMPNDIGTLYQQFISGKTVPKGILAAVIILAIIVAMVVFVVLLQDGVRKIPVQYSKKIQGRKQVGGQSTHIPLSASWVLFQALSPPPNAARSKQVCFPTYWHHAHSSMAPRLSW